MEPDTSLKDPDKDDTPASAKVRACLGRIASRNDRLHAVSVLLSDRARERAAALDNMAMLGQPCGALHGMPFLVKELADIEGLPTAFGSLAYTSAAASVTAPALRRLEEAGAILLGTTHMVEFAIGSWGTNHAKGTPWNPAAPTVHHIAGGSSSGSAVAVAAGLAPVAIGSDTGGSIRIPASLCGVVGFKPTYGLIPTEGVAPLGPTFDTLGPITRTVSEARLLTEAMAGISLSHPPVSIAGLRIAVASDAELAPMSGTVAGAYAVALSSLRAQGARIEEIELPLSFVEFQKLNGDIVAFEAYRHLAHLVDDPATPLDPYVRTRVLVGKRISPTQYEDRLNRLAEVRSRFDEVWTCHDALVLPGTPTCALPLSDVDESSIPMSRYTRVANCLDLCAISLPVTRDAGELPVGIQICGPAHSDARLLAIASEAIGVI